MPPELSVKVKIICDEYVQLCVLSEAMLILKYVNAWLARWIRGRIRLIVLVRTLIPIFLIFNVAKSFLLVSFWLY